MRRVASRLVSEKLFHLNWSSRGFSKTSEWRVWNPTCVRWRQLSPNIISLRSQSESSLRCLTFFSSTFRAHIMSNIKCNHFDNFFFSFTNYLAINLLRGTCEHRSRVERKHHPAPSTSLILSREKLRIFRKQFRRGRYTHYDAESWFISGCSGARWRKIHARQVDGWKIHKIREMISPQEHPPGR